MKLPRRLAPSGGDGLRVPLLLGGLLTVALMALAAACGGGGEGKGPTAAPPETSTNGQGAPTSTLATVYASPT